MEKLTDGSMCPSSNEKLEMFLHIPFPSGGGILEITTEALESQLSCMTAPKYKGETANECENSKATKGNVGNNK